MEKRRKWRIPLQLNTKDCREGLALLGFNSTQVETHLNKIFVTQVNSHFPCSNIYNHRMYLPKKYKGAILRRCVKHSTISNVAKLLTIIFIYYVI
jgi:hypothetical protein